MLESALITSLKILFVYAAMKEGNILFWLRRLIDWMIEPLPAKFLLWLRKPLYDCIFCMASIWGVVFTFQTAFIRPYPITLYLIGHLVHFNIWFLDKYYITFLFIVAGINYIIQSMLKIF